MIGYVTFFYSVKVDHAMEFPTVLISGRTVPPLPDPI